MVSFSARFTHILRLKYLSLLFGSSKNLLVTINMAYMIILIYVWLWLMFELHWHCMHGQFRKCRRQFGKYSLSYLLFCTQFESFYYRKIFLFSHNVKVTVAFREECLCTLVRKDCRHGRFFFFDQSPVCLKYLAVMDRELSWRNLSIESLYLACWIVLERDSQSQNCPNLCETWSPSFCVVFVSFPFLHT